MSQMDLQWFAAEDEGRTEEPSEGKLRRLREKGEVAKSQELNGAFVFFFCVILLLFLGSWILKRCENILTFFFNNINVQEVKRGQFAYIFFKEFILLVLPFGLMGALAAFASNFMQNRGWLVATERIKPNFSRLVPHVMEYLKNTLFSFMGVYNIIKSLVKVFVLAFVIFIVIYLNRHKLLGMLTVASPLAGLKVVSKIIAQILIIAAVFFLAVGVIDYVFQRRQFREKNKMTKQEVKEEFKEEEGDPEVKNRLEQAQRELLSKNIRKAVRESDVVVTNPEHYAVALKYVPEVDDGPKVNAKGEDETAALIKSYAREFDVPITENRYVARSLYTLTKVGDIIPYNMLHAVVAIYAKLKDVERFTGKKKK